MLIDKQPFENFQTLRGLQCLTVDVLCWRGNQFYVKRIYD